MSFSIHAGRAAPGLRVFILSIALGFAALATFPADPAQAVHAKSKVGPKTPRKPAAPPAELASEAATRVAEWVAGSGDNAALPYIVIDKQAAALSLYDASGKLLGRAPVLLGIAKGDEASPGVGSKSLAKLGPAEKTTPAGRFLAKYGRAVGHDRVLWVDYSNSVALHAVVTSNPKERRLARLQSPTADDNRISFGCINVPTAFYNQKIRPLYAKKGGMVYVLPETRPLEEIFPLMRGWPPKSPAA